MLLVMGKILLFLRVSSVFAPCFIRVCSLVTPYLLCISTIPRLAILLLCNQSLVFLLFVPLMKGGNTEQIVRHCAERIRLVATHSPLVMASIEPLFDIQKDKIFHLDLVRHDLFGTEVELQEPEFSLYGTADSWLRSDL